MVAAIVGGVVLAEVAVEEGGGFAVAAGFLNAACFGVAFLANFDCGRCGGVVFLWRQ